MSRVLVSGPASRIVRPGLGLAFAACVSVSASAVSSVAQGATAVPEGVTGVFEAEGVGKLELSLAPGDRLVGRFLGGGQCPFEANQRVIEGRFEGNVLAGSVLLCQTGAGCGMRVYPLLAFYNPVERWFVGDVKLEAACASPALRSTRLRLERLPAEEQAELKADQTPARRRAHRARNEALYQGLLQETQRSLDAGDLGQAAQQLEVALTHVEDDVDAYALLAQVEVRRGRLRRALSCYERAKDLVPDASVRKQDLLVRAAALHARLGARGSALATIRDALREGLARPGALTAEPELQRALGEDAEFLALVEDVTQAAQARSGAVGKRER